MDLRAGMSRTIRTSRTMRPSPGRQVRSGPELGEEISAAMHIKNAATPSSELHEANGPLSLQLMLTHDARVLGPLSLQLMLKRRVSGVLGLLTLPLMLVMRVCLGSLGRSTCT